LQNGLAELVDAALDKVVVLLAHVLEVLEVALGLIHGLVQPQLHVLSECLIVLRFHSLPRLLGILAAFVCLVIRGLSPCGLLGLLMVLGSRGCRALLLTLLLLELPVPLEKTLHHLLCHQQPLPKVVLAQVGNVALEIVVGVVHQLPLCINALLEAHRVGHEGTGLSTSLGLRPTRHEVVLLNSAKNDSAGLLTGCLVDGAPCLPLLGPVKALLGLEVTLLLLELPLVVDVGVLHVLQLEYGFLEVVAELIGLPPLGTGLSGLEIELGIKKLGLGRGEGGSGVVARVEAELALALSVLTLHVVLAD